MEDGKNGLELGLVGVVGVMGPEAKAALSVAAKADVMHADETVLVVLVPVLNKTLDADNEQVDGEQARSAAAATLASVATRTVTETESDDWLLLLPLLLWLLPVAVPLLLGWCERNQPRALATPTSPKPDVRLVFNTVPLVLDCCEGE